MTLGAGNEVHLAEHNGPGTGGLDKDRYQSGQGKSSQVGLPQLGPGTGKLGTWQADQNPKTGANTAKLPPIPGPEARPVAPKSAVGPGLELPPTSQVDMWRKSSEAPPGQSKLPPASGTGSLAKGPTRPPPTRCEVQEELAKHAEFEAVMASRMRFLSYVLTLQSRSLAAVRMALAKQKPDIAQMAEGLLLALQKKPELAQQMQEALSRSAQAAAMARDAEQRLARHAELPAALAAGALVGFDLLAFRRAIFWLSTLDATFADQSILSQVFPPVARKGSPTGMLATTAPKKLPARAPTGPAPAGDRPLQQAAKSSPLAPRGDPASEASQWLGRTVRRLEDWLADATQKE